MMAPSVGVIGTGAMGLGVVKSLVRAGFRVLARDIDARAEAAAVASAAEARSSSADLARDCRAIVVLVIDAPQVDAVFFGDKGRGADSNGRDHGDDPGAAGALAPGSVVFMASTVAPAYVAALATELHVTGITLIDAPVSGGPRRAADATMTMMLAGDASVIAASDTLLRAIAGTRFVVGQRAGDAATFKILNNQLAAVNLAAGAEAMALAMRAGLDPRRFLDVVNASSGASWIFADRMARALDGNVAPHAATTLLTKDVGIAVELARTLGCEASFARVAHDAFVAAVAAGLGAEDDAALLKFYRDRIAGPSPM